MWRGGSSRLCVWCQRKAWISSNEFNEALAQMKKKAFLLIKSSQNDKTTKWTSSTPETTTPAGKAPVKAKYTIAATPFPFCTHSFSKIVITNTLGLTWFDKKLPPKTAFTIEITNPGLDAVFKCCAPGQADGMIGRELFRQMLVKSIFDLNHILYCNAILKPSKNQVQLFIKTLKGGINRC